MEERDKQMDISKSKDHEKLIVFYAASFPNEIRFYLNNTKYITAIEEGEKNISVRIGDDVEWEEDKKSVLAIIKENFKEFFKLFCILMLILMGVEAIIFEIAVYIDSLLICLIAADLLLFAYRIIAIVILEMRNTAPALKSKHSAEHMMVNFLENNRRLPKNMQEIRKSSRFNEDCGSKERIKGIAEDFISQLLAAILAISVNSLYLLFFKKSIIVEFIVFMVVFYFTSYLVGVLIRNYGLFGFVINPIKRALTNIAQCGNTTKNVKDKDILLAYRVASVWMQVVYPEFYKKDEDVFMKNYSS